MRRRRQPASAGWARRPDEGFPPLLPARDGWLVAALVAAAMTAGTVAVLAQVLAQACAWGCP